jgi:prepilin-type N-terminal cleavage/methylation domain-containing protein/prepilin-type processing-associated H-X9-DG protein
MRSSIIPHLHIPQRRRAFTLIEMLVVIAILALLMALVFPAVSSSMMRASMAKATSNFRQLGTVLMIHSVENRGRLPGPLYTNQRSGYRQGLPLGIGAKLWAEMGLSPPTADYQPVPLLIVPALWKWPYTINDPNPGAYTVVRDVPMPDGTTGHPFGLSNNMSLATLRLFEIPNPTTTWAIWERGGPGDPSAGNRSFSEPIHGKRRVVLFFDGHVQAVPSDQLPAFMNP